MQESWPVFVGSSWKHDINHYQCLTQKLYTVNLYYFQHISWLWYPCPNYHSAGEGTLIADGTTVSNTSLYGVRIIGQNGLFISELHILQNPLQSGIEGLYRCEAWPHGPNKDIINQTSSRYHDEFIIGGHLMVKSCFYDPHRDKYYYQHYGPMSYSHKVQKHYRTPRKKIVPDVSINMIHGSVKWTKHMYLKPNGQCFIMFEC